VRDNHRQHRYHSLTNYCVDVNSLHLQQNVSSFDNALTQMRMISKLVSEDTNFVQLMRKNAETSESCVLALQRANNNHAQLGADLYVLALLFYCFFA